MGAQPSLAVFLGGVGGSPVEEWMRGVLEAAALDLAESALASSVFGRVVLAADRAPAGDMPAGVEVRVDGAGATGRAFRFGEAFVALAGEMPSDGVAYIGAGSGPLLGVGEFEAIAAPLRAPGAANVIVTNNRFSSDLFALADLQRVADLDPAALTDNAIPRRLRDEHGMEVLELPRTLATQFNLDTPSDAIALALSGRGGPRLTAALAGVPATERMQRAARLFIERTAEVLVAGRVSSRTWQYLETETACRIRLLSEERGMQAAGTDAAGTARSILGQLIAEAGPARAFGVLLPELCAAAFIDIRPALVQLGIRASKADRFAADLGRVDEIEDAGLRAIVAAAAASPVPVILGGHSLVGGALELLNQWAWDEHDAKAGG